jgi:cyclase
MGWKMLKKRIIPIQLLSNSRLCKTEKFLNPRDVGDPVMSSKVYSNQDADELVLLQIDRIPNAIEVLVSTVKNIAEECFVPLTVGGGIKTLQDAEKLFNAGADKVIVNSSAYTDHELINQIAKLAGVQAIVIGIDVRFEDNVYKLYSSGASMLEDISLSEHITNVISAGAGEILIQSIDRDGVMEGYDLELLGKVCSLSTVPVISAGGAGDFHHLHDAFNAGVDAIACGSLFNFGDNNPLRAKAFLKNYGIPLKTI